MKTNDYFLALAVAAYSYLFYQQNAGVNFLLFNLFMIGILSRRNPALLKQKNWLWAAALCLVSSTGILLHSSALALIANCCSLLLLSAFSINSATSAVFSFLFGAYSLASAGVFMMMDAVTKGEKRTHSRTYQARFMALILVVFACFFFFILYKAANPLFAENTKWINLDFISFGWCFFTFGGLLISYGLFYSRTIPIIERWENGIPLFNINADPEKHENYRLECIAGLVFFACLNLMLVLLNAGDVSTIWFKGVLPKGMTHADFVHNGVGIMIFSIVTATGLILYLQRKDFSAVAYSKPLKWLIYLWIVQNLVMLFSTACRNHLYIQAYMLTYMRIGVYVWLGLSALGLIITFIKLLRGRSGWYLVRTNVAAWFCVLGLASLFNWDVLITRYNLHDKALKDVDLYYLFSLSDANLPELTELYRQHGAYILNQNLQNNGGAYDGAYSSDYRELLQNKAGRFLKDYTNSWQSWDLRDKRITECILK